MYSTHRTVHTVLYIWPIAGRVEKVAYKCDDVRTYTTIGCRPTFIDSTNHEVTHFGRHPAPESTATVSVTVISV